MLTRYPLARHLLMMALLLAVAFISTWVLYRLNLTTSTLGLSATNSPDYYMEDFTTTAMDENGDPDYKLYAIYMAHYPANDTTEVLRPSMEFYRPDQPPLRVVADKGWLTSGNEVVLLSGNVAFTETDIDGQPVLQINTRSARLLINQNYAETDDYASIRARRTSITGTGMRANFNDGKLKVLNDVHTIITTR